MFFRFVTTSKVGIPFEKLPPTPTPTFGHPLHPYISDDEIVLREVKKLAYVFMPVSKKRRFQIQNSGSKTLSFL